MMRCGPGESFPRREYHRAGGGSRTFKARDPARLKQVKVGDLVDIPYSEALAVAVKPIGKP
jgi:hypothetical protein